jgi:hypothetical protein
VTWSRALVSSVKRPPSGLRRGWLCGRVAMPVIVEGSIAMATRCESVVVDFEDSGVACSLLMHARHSVLLCCIRFRVPWLAAGALSTANKEGGVGDGNCMYSHQDRLSSSSAHTSCAQRCCRGLRVRRCVMAQAGWHCRRNVGWRT